MRCSQGWATTPNSKISAAWSQEPLETLGASGDSVPPSTEVRVAGPGWGGRDRAGWVWLLGATWWQCAAEAADLETRGSLCNSYLMLRMVLLSHSPSSTPELLCFLKARVSLWSPGVVLGVQTLRSEASHRPSSSSDLRALDSIARQQQRDFVSTAPPGLRLAAGPWRHPKPCTFLLALSSPVLLSCLLGVPVYAVPLWEHCSCWSPPESQAAAMSVTHMLPVHKKRFGSEWQKVEPEGSMQAWSSLSQGTPSWDGSSLPAHSGDPRTRNCQLWRPLHWFCSRGL